jgi:glycosyltransferase involved in cell wall biosynthesis
MRVVMLVMNDMRADARVEREAGTLADAGHAVTVVALSGEGLPRSEERRGWAVRRVAAPGRASWREPVAKVRQGLERQRAFVSAATAARPDVVHAHDADTFTAGEWVARRCRARLVCDAHELYPDMLLANRPSVSVPVLRYWACVERRGLRRADATMTVGDAIAAEFARRYGVRPRPLLNVPLLEPVGDRGALRERLGLAPERVIVLYQGLINLSRGIRPLIDALAAVPEADIVLQGQGAMVDRYLREAAQCGVGDRVHFLGLAPVEELTRWASGADIGAVLIENASLNNYLCSPNKAYQYLMAGICLLGSDFPGIGALIRDEVRCGLVCDPSRPEQVAEALAELVALGPAGRRAMGVRARAAAEARYNWEVEKSVLLDVYDRLAGP